MSVLVLPMESETTIGKMDCTVHPSEGMSKCFFGYHARGWARPFVKLSLFGIVLPELKG
jgi:hypothetical protein